MKELVVTIVERWVKEDNTVYREWSLDGGRTWKKERTAYPEVPVVYAPWNWLSRLVFL